MLVFGGGDKGCDERLMKPLIFFFSIRPGAFGSLGQLVCIPFPIHALSPSQSQARSPFVPLPSGQTGAGIGPRLVPLRPMGFVDVNFVDVDVVVAIAAAAAATVAAALRLVVACFFIVIAAVEESAPPTWGGERRR